MLKRRMFLSLPALLAGCGGGGGTASPTNQPNPEAAAPVKDSLLHKLGVFVQDGLETALVVFGGEVLAISFDRPWSGFAATGFTVRRWATGQVLAQHSWPGGMGCAIVKNGVIHIFGNTNWQNLGNKIIHSTLAADFTPSAPIDALLMNAPSNPFRFYNTSVTADPNGFRMVVETNVGVYFARSTDLNSWTFYGGQLLAGQYCGCPSIHYIRGAHYLTYLASTNGGHETRVAKSLDDCFTFTYGKTILSASTGEGNNNSDVDMVELNGRVCGVYLDGDQTTYAHLRAWSYEGTLAEVFAEFS